MADPLATPAVVGAGVSALFGEVIEILKRAYHCKEQCKSLQATLEEVSPLVGKVVQGADNGNDTCREWLSGFVALLSDAKKETEKCSRTSRLLVWKASKLSSRITCIDQKIKEKASPGVLVVLDILQDLRASQAAPQRVVRCAEFIMQPVPQKIVAFEADPFDKLKKLIEDAADAMESPTTLGLKGTGGAGKTTIAQMLNNDPDIQAKYGGDSILWMTIGHDVGDVESVQRSLGKFLNDERLESWDHADRSVEDRHAYLMQAFQRRKVLLILDDVWDVQRGGREMMFWLDVAKAPGSVTLITTRDGAILDRFAAKEKVAVVSLSGGESWELFCHYAFDSAIGAPDRGESEMTKVAWEVCKECKGLPLALRVIGSAMRGRGVIGEWRDALRRLRASEGLSNCKSVDGDLFHRLGYSYAELDEVTKKCFLYFAAFPEDYGIPVKELIAVWRAEELFGRDIGGGDVDDAGCAQLLVLERRSLIELDQSRDGRPEYAKVHDIIRDLACDIIRKARPGEWASECYFEPGKELGISSRARGRVKRMSFMEGGVPPGTIDVSNVQVCLVWKSSKVGEVKVFNIAGSFFSSMIDLRYLDMSGCKSVQCIAEDIKKLTCLTHLDLSETEVERLPEGIEDLRSLSHLDLSRTKLETFPESIKDLRSLTHLNLSETKLERLPEGIKELNALTYLDLRWTKLDRLPMSFKDLTTLIKLDLSGTKLESLPEGIKEMTSLVELHLSWTMFKRLPEGIKELASLTHLNLRGTKLERLPQGIMELSSLKYLNLSRTKLERLPKDIRDLTSLKWLDLSETKLERLPEGIEELTSLQHLNLWGTKFETLSKSIQVSTSLLKYDLTKTNLETCARV